MTALHDDDISDVLIKGSVALLLILSLSGLLLFSPRTGLGVLAGGIVGIANFLWMRSTLGRILCVQPTNSGRQAVLWFVVRMLVLAMVLCPLLVSGFFSPTGLLVGLSTIVVSIVALTFRGALRRGRLG
jgi:hypothetical protein